MLIFVSCNEAGKSNVVVVQNNMNISAQDFKESSPENLNLIVPGRSVGNLDLGMSKEDILKKLENKKYYIFNIGSKGEGCPEIEVDVGDENQVLNRTKVKNGIRVFINDGRTFQIKAESFLYSTNEKITSDSSVKDVLKTYQRVKAYKLLNSSSNLTGPRDLVYLVDEDKGIAFEFYYNQKEKNRKVGFIYVFRKGEPFKPDVSSPMDV